MRTPNKNKEYGMTIVELLVVLAIVFIVSTLALTLVGVSKKSLEMQNVSSEFKSYLERARFDSVKRNATVVDEFARVTINSPTSFITATDFNQNGTLESGEIRNVDFSYQDEIVFYSDRMTLPVVVSFNKKGHTTAIDGNGNSITPTFLICRQRCENISTDSGSFQIMSVTPTGTVILLNGDELLNTPEVPTNITSSSSAGINPLVSTVASDGSIPVIDKVTKNK